MPEKSKADLRQTKTFRKIEQHLKVRRKNAAMDTGPIDPRMESYVDKDRAIAVVSGKPLFSRKEIMPHIQLSTYSNICVGLINCVATIIKQWLLDN
jgi:hypothetical protein